ncbi:Ig-like domain-containing protein [Chryseobacterium terrae]|uniref:T9SS type A sorting domain-containing protein n=1 Tax=Chryseobacterium terrae TaxID=3163299 RepID=A0ABW8Y765_9FLAO
MMKFYNFLQKQSNFKIRYLTLILFCVSIITKAQVSAYTFAQSQGTYTPLTGGTVLATATGVSGSASLDSAVYPVNIPFNFMFNNVNYSSLNVSTNGYITFGTTAAATGTSSPISSNNLYDGAVSAWGRDLNAVFVNGVAGNITWDVVGTAPNREIVIQWTDFKPVYNSAATNVYTFSFQIRLRETTNTIATVYKQGSFLVGSTAVSSTAQIGLRGTSAFDFNNRTNTTSVLFGSSEAGTANNSSQAFNTSASPPGMPMDGLTYEWTPATCYPPSNVIVNNITPTTANVTWTASVILPANGYEVYYSDSSTPPTATTTPNYTGVMGTSQFISSGLQPLTRYYVWVRSACTGTDKSIWTLMSSFFTTCQPTSITSTTGATVCPGGMATLSADTPTGVNVNWYDSQLGGNLVGTGNSYTTPSLTSTTTYYATSFTGEGPFSVGKTTYTTNPTSGTGVTNYGLVFDVIERCVLENVTIYPTAANAGTQGTVTIDVIDGNNNVLQSKTLIVTAGTTDVPVAQVVDLYFTFTAGTNYKIRMSSYTGINGLLFDPAANTPGGIGGSYAFPYSLNNLMTIKSSTLTSAPTNTPRYDLYYYFYDWKVSTKCESARQPVVATVDVNCLATSETKAKDNIKVYPNPFSDIVNITQVELVKSIKVSDVSGKLVKTINNPTSTLRLGDLSQGMYILLFDMKDGSKLSHKIIKK